MNSVNMSESLTTESCSEFYVSESLAGESSEQRPKKDSVHHLCQCVLNV